MTDHLFAVQLKKITPIFSRQFQCVCIVLKHASCSTLTWQSYFLHKRLVIACHPFTICLQLNILISQWSTPDLISSLKRLIPKMSCTLAKNGRHKRYGCLNLSSQPQRQFETCVHAKKFETRELACTKHRQFLRQKKLLKIPKIKSFLIVVISINC